MSTLKERTEEYIKKLDSMSNKEILCNFKLNHKPLYTEEDLIGKSEADQKWIKVLMKADEIFERLEPTKDK